METGPLSELLCCGCLVAGRRVSRLLEPDLRDLYSQLSNAPLTDLELGSHDVVCWECCAGLRRVRAFQRQVHASYKSLREHLMQDPSLENIYNVAIPSHLQVHKLHSHSYPVGLFATNEDDDVKSEFWDSTIDATKTDMDIVKSEPEENDLDALDDLDHHSEPETFVKSITGDAPDSLAKKELKQEKKKKSKHKDKLRKEKIKKEKKKVKEKPKKREGKVRKVKKKPKIIDDLTDDEADMKENASHAAENASLATADLEASSDCLSDLESVIDYYTDIPTVSQTPKVPKEKAKLPKVKLDKEQFDSTDIKLITLTHEEMLKEREKEALADYFAKCPHQCKDCILGFKYERTLLTHMETKHSESAGEHMCPVCRVRLPDATELAEHSRRHLLRYKCTVCGKRSLTLLPMVKHVRNHKEYRCDLCDQLSGSLFRHQTHMAKEHKEKPKCVECGKMFSSRKTYLYHMNVIHKGQNRFPCPHCGKIYQWKSNLWRHIKNHKARDNGELYCAPCNKKFSSIATYQQHLKVSRKHVTENEFNYMCSECGKKFANKTRLRDHVDWDHLKKINYRCQLCDKPFKSNTSLYVHMQNVHKNKDEKDNLCHVCGKSYQNIAKLKYHIVAMHTTETPYSCEQCPSAFSWYSSLYRHVKEVHEKVRMKKKRVRRKDGAPAPALGAPAPPPLHSGAPHM